MSTNVAKPVKVAIIGASGTYGKGILARAEEIGIEAVVVTRSPHKFKDVKPTTTVVNAELDEEEKLKEAFAGCDGVCSTSTTFSHGRQLKFPFPRERGCNGMRA